MIRSPEESYGGCGSRGFGRRIYRALRPGGHGPGPGALWDGTAGIDDGGEVAVTDDARQVHPRRAGWARGDSEIL